MARIFHKSIERSASVLSFDPESHRIFYSTIMYDEKLLTQKMVEVDITEQAWQELVKYGQQAGFSED